MQTTAHLLDDFARTRSEGSLRAIIDRHLGLVYVAALRVTRSEAMAKDVAQDIFLKLAQKPAAIPSSLAFFCMAAPRRSKYKADPEFAKVKKAYDRKEAPEFRYHRFWAQVEYATACAVAAKFAPAK